MTEILVVTEHRRGQLDDTTFELLDLARTVAPTIDAEVVALALAAEAEALAAELVRAADRVLAMADPLLQSYDAEIYLPVLQTIIEQRRPALVLMAHTAQGMDLAPALAARLRLPLVTDCAAVQRRGDAWTALRHIYGGKLEATLTLKPAASVLMSIRPGCFAAAADAGKSAAVQPIACPDLSGRRQRRLVGFEAAALEDVDIAAADVLVSVGRGVGKPENMAAVQAFADAIGATLCCSRPVADKGWLPKSRQVGTSGKTVRPKIYLALGISGAFQHQAGMKNSGTIIAVNSDARAPIFQVAHYGIVADLFEVLPKLAERFGG